MFERFSEAARLALFGAHLEVREAGGTAIEPEHVLLGLLQAKGGIAERVLRDAGLDANSVRTKLLPQASAAPSTHVEIPFGPTTKTALLVAVAEADAMSSTQITTGHLLLALLRDQHGAPHALLRAAGLDLNALRSVVDEHAAGTHESDVPGVQELFEQRFRNLGLI